jgi:hypothetical protein
MAALFSCQEGQFALSNRRFPQRRYLATAKQTKDTNAEGITGIKKPTEEANSFAGTVGVFVSV